MPVLQIKIYGDPILTKKAEPIKNINDTIVELAQSMVKTMHSAPGIGLSAPQVNKSKRLITVDLSLGEKSEDLIILANPELLDQEGEIISEEGCLSLPGIQEKVPRSAKAVIKGIDMKDLLKLRACWLGFYVMRLITSTENYSLITSLRLREV